MRKEPVNPFAPPRVAETLASEGVQPIARRDGDLMVVGKGARLPSVCFVNGERAIGTITVQTMWQPGWVYLTMIPLLVPYLFVSPFYIQSVTLEVPYGERLRRSYHRRVTLAVSAGACFAVLVVFSWLGSASGPLGIGIIGMVFCMIMSTRKMIQLSVAYADPEMLILRDVHPACLEELPPLYA
ncbi:MAG TPA: hypothetical protein DDW52_26930 [Planctomycetaceae bacterium]|nr:hypothetical protein [Planctomycetaceae bacterium]